MLGKSLTELGRRLPTVGTRRKCGPARRRAVPGGDATSASGPKPDEEVFGSSPSQSLLLCFSVPPLA